MIILRNQKEYQQVFHAQEREFEPVAAKQLAVALPEFHVVPFKPLVLGETGIRRRPDLALIHKKYAMWVVVEVELEHHSLEHHVMPQAATLATGSYGEAHAEALNRNRPELDAGRLARLVEYRQPSVMVLVNSRSVLHRGWKALTTEHGVELTMLEVFRSISGDTIFNLDGYLPKPISGRLTGARKAPMMNALECGGTPSLPERVLMTYDGRPTEWICLSTADRVVLIPRTFFEIAEDRNYEIMKAADGQLILRKL